MRGLIQKIYAVDMRRVSKITFELLDRIQQKRAEEIVAAGAVFFLQLCRRYRIDPRRVLEAVERIVRDAEDRYPDHVRALRTYLDQEIAA